LLLFTIADAAGYAQAFGATIPAVWVGALALRWF
jgi:hypothetical protein